MACTYGWMASLTRGRGRLGLLLILRHKTASSMHNASYVLPDTALVGAMTGSRGAGPGRRACPAPARQQTPRESIRCFTAKEVSRQAGREPKQAGRACSLGPSAGCLPAAGLDAAAGRASQGRAARVEAHRTERAGGAHQEVGREQAGRQAGTDPLTQSALGALLTPPACWAACLPACVCARMVSQAYDFNDFYGRTRVRRSRHLSLIGRAACVWRALSVVRS